MADKENLAAIRKMVNDAAARIGKPSADRPREQIQGVSDGEKLAAIRRLVNEYSLYGSVPCDRLDEVLDDDCHSVDD